MTKHHRYTTLAVTDTTTGATISWTDGILRHDDTDAGRSLAEKAQATAALALVDRTVDDPNFGSGPRTPTLDADGDPVDVLATLAAATDGHWAIAAAPERVTTALLADEDAVPTGPDDIPLDDPAVTVIH